MLPFKISCYDKTDGKFKDLNIGLFLNNEDDSILKSDNFAFKVSASYDWNSKKSNCCFVVTDGKVHNIYNNRIASSSEKTISLKRKEYYIIDNRIFSFPVLDNENNIKYPFDIVSLNFDTNANRFFVIHDINRCRLPASMIFEQSLIKRIKEYSGVDISVLNNTDFLSDARFDNGCAMIGMHLLQTYINSYSDIKDFRECINRGVKSAYGWLYYSDSTIKKKAKEALKEYKDNSFETLPDFVQKYISDSRVKDGEKNVLSLYNLGFSENDFICFKKMFKNFGNTSYNRYVQLYNFLNNNCNRPIGVSEALSYILLNTKKGKNCTVAYFFSTLDSFETTNKRENINLEKEIFEAIIEGNFKSESLIISDKIIKIREKNKIEMLNQYPEINLSEFPYSPLNILRINSKEDVPNGVLIPGTDEILFCFDNSCYSSAEEKTKYLLVDLNRQSYKIYGFVKSIYSNPYLALLYSNGEKQGYFNNYMLDRDIYIINNILSKYVFPQYIESKVCNIFMNDNCVNYPA